MIDVNKVVDFIVNRLYGMYDSDNMIMRRQGGHQEILGSGDNREGGARTEWRQFISPNYANQDAIRPCVDVSFPSLETIDDTLKGASISGTRTGMITASSPYAYLDGTCMVQVVDRLDENYMGSYSLANAIAEQWPAGYEYVLSGTRIQVSRSPHIRGGYTDETGFIVPVLIPFTASKA